MRRPWRLMRKLGRQLLAGPYLVWMIGFILLPIVIILYYAFTNTSGAFTWDNIAAIADPVHVKSILLSLKLGFFLYNSLSAACLSACDDLKQFSF